MANHTPSQPQKNTCILCHAPKENKSVNVKYCASCKHAIYTEQHRRAAIRHARKAHNFRRAFTDASYFEVVLD